MMKKVGQVFYGFIPVIVYIIVQFAVIIIAGMVEGFKQGILLVREGVSDEEIITKTVEDIMLNPDFIMITSCISSVILILVFSYWYRKGYVRESKEDLIRLLQVRKLIYLIILGFSLQIALSFLIGVIRDYQPEWFIKYNELINQIGMGRNMVSFVYIVILAPIVEEYLMRGLVLNQMKRSMPFVAANIIQAFLFALIHGNIVQGMYSFVLGILFGYVYEEFKTIWSTILFHTVFNLGGCLLSWFLPDSLQITIQISLLIGFVALIFSFILIKQLLNREGELQINEEFEEVE